jgi:hypothetical protein
VSRSGSYRRTRDGTLRHQLRAKDRPGTGLAQLSCPACGKWAYVTRRDAKTAAAQYEARRQGRFRVYRCGEYWHLTGLGTSATAWYREHDS